MYKMINKLSSPMRFNRIEPYPSILLNPKGVDGDFVLLDERTMQELKTGILYWINQGAIEVQPYVEKKEVKKEDREPKETPQQTPQRNTKPVHTEESLFSMAMNDIREIAKNIGAKPARSKEDQIQNILEAQSSKDK